MIIAILGITKIVTSKKRKLGGDLIEETKHELFDLTCIDESDDEMEFMGSTGKNGLPQKAGEFIDKFDPYFSS